MANINDIIQKGDRKWEDVKQYMSYRDAMVRSSIIDSANEIEESGTPRLIGQLNPVEITDNYSMEQEKLEYE